jgi:4-hydroxybenzoate polyprenyltransferase
LIAVLLGVAFSMSGRDLVMVAGTVLVGQLSIGWSNDWLDAQRDAAAGRVGKPTVAGAVSTHRVRAVALLALALSLPLSLLAGWDAALAHLLLVASGWAYNARLKASIWSPAPYLVGFAALPMYVSLAADASPRWWLSVSAGLLGVAAHFANAAPDIEDDLASGIRGAPQRIGARRSLSVSFALLASVSVLLLLHLPDGQWFVFAATAAFTPVVAGALLAWHRGASRGVFVAVMVAALVDVSLLVTVA